MFNCSLYKILINSSTMRWLNINFVPWQRNRALLLFREYLCKKTSYVGSLHKANKNVKYIRRSVVRLEIWYFEHETLWEKNWPIPCQCYCSSTHLTFYFDKYIHSFLLKTSVRPKPKFRPKFRSKSAEIVRPKFRSIRRNAEIAKKRHFDEFLPFFTNFFQSFFLKLIRSINLICNLSKVSNQMLHCNFNFQISPNCEENFWS